MAQSTFEAALFRARVFQTKRVELRMQKPSPDTYEQMAIQSAARTGHPQLSAFRAALEGRSQFSAQIRVLLQYVRRGHLTLDDLKALAERDRKAAP